MEVIGKIKLVGSVQEVSTSFKKREVVVTTEEQYPQHISIEFQQDKIDLLNGLEVGQEVKVHINLRGREWVSPQGETKHFNTITGWKIEKQNTSEPEKPNTKSTVHTYTTTADSNQEEDPDLPF